MLLLKNYFIFLFEYKLKHLLFDNFTSEYKRIQWQDKICKMILIMRCDIDKTNKKKDKNISGVYNKFGNAIFMKDRQLKQRTNVVEIKIKGSKLQFKRM